MPVPKHLEEAASRAEAAEARIRELRSGPTTQEKLEQWLAALTDYVVALSDVHRFTNESVHEKLHDLAGRMGIRPFPTDRARIE